MTAGDPGSASEVFYRYGKLAWLWRLLAGLGIAAGALLIFLAFRFGSWVFVASALPLLVPSVTLPWMVAYSIDRLGDDEIEVVNLFGMRRRVSRNDLEKPRFKRTAQATFTHIDAPRAWIGVRGGAPIYVDLYATIPDPAAFRKFFRLPKR